MAVHHGGVTWGLGAFLTVLLASAVAIAQPIADGSAGSGSGSSNVMAAPPCAVPDEEYCRDLARLPEDDHDMKSGTGFQIGLDGTTVFDAHHGSPAPTIGNVSMVMAHVQASSGGPSIRYFFGFDFGIGATAADAGFGYDAQLLPFGLGLQLGTPKRTAFVGVAAGIGASGALSSLPSAAFLPVQLAGVFRLTTGSNLQLRVRDATMLNRTSRDRGAPSAPFGDELDGMIALQLSGRENYIEGYYYGVAYRELEGGRFVGVVFGWCGGEETMEGYTNQERIERMRAHERER
jgi:hypothetical protein